MFYVDDKKVNCGGMENEFCVVQEKEICNSSGIWIFALNTMASSEEIALVNASEEK